ncbi:protein transport protein Sec24C isoform X2 [Drosophila novamexicana]|uniref:protein transport protein Sec24C isoform X2 n=1 Tax=Drosophila novamexicana TaxID=47314 RepID=UPI0011E5BA0D|nr:protein transport protein Sec24C isoform X2 [Drosophila novamexicana]
MNPNMYGPPPAQFQPQYAAPPPISGTRPPTGWPQQQQQQQLPPPPAQQQHPQQQQQQQQQPQRQQQQQQQPQQQQQYGAAVTSAQQPYVNGNYQQLATSMSGLSVSGNPLKPAQPSLPMPSVGVGAAAPPGSYNQFNSNAPPTSQPLPPAGSGLSFNNNNNAYAAAYANGSTAPSPAPPVSAAGGAAAPPPSLYPPTSAAPTSAPPTLAPAPMPQSVPSGINQMTLNSANLAGLPHMPPPKPAGQQLPPTSSAAAQPPPPAAQSAPGAYGRPGQPLQPPGSAAPGTFAQSGMPPQPAAAGGPYGIPTPGNYPGGYAGQPNPAFQGAPPLPGQQPAPPHPQQFGAAPPPVVGFPPQPGQQLQQPSMPGYPPQPMPGYPPQPGQQPQQPMPGYPPQPGTYPGQPGPGRPGYNPPMPGAGNMYQQAPPRRLDPDQMPNPIQVMIENQQAAGGPFVTNQAGLLPPLVTTKFVVHDQGNSSPRFIRSSLYCIPNTGDLLKTTALPLTLNISPLARIGQGEMEPPIVNFGDMGPIRCNRCKAYMSPNMQFVDAGRRFQCLMCKVTTEVHPDYYQHLDHTGQRVDKHERPELLLGTYEFLATKDYCRNNTAPEVPAFIFIIDVSYNTIKSGLVHLLCSQIKHILKHLPVDQGQDKSKVRVGFITYNSTVHFYNIKSSLAQPQMMVVGDVQEMFMPLLDGFLCHPEESAAVIDALMEEIPRMFVDTKETETILYPAIQAGLEALKASNASGKLLVFNSTLPIAEAPGKLKNRDDRKLLGTDKEKTVLTPQTTAYNQLGQECVQQGCSVDLFVFNNAYIDIATIGQVSRLTGGEVYKYTYFQAELDGKRLIEDIIKNVSRPIAFDAVMRVRTSAGIRPTEFFGHFYMTNTTDVELASIDATKSVSIEIKHDDKLPPEENVYIQVALLYTSCSGQRRLRILNLALRVTVTIADVFKSCDLDAMMLFFAKQACFKLMEHSPKQVKDNLIQRSAQILACYRKHCTSPTSAGQLILPECLKLLPLYSSCLLKNDAVSGGSDMTLDDRSYVIQFVLAMDLNMSVNYLYPRFIPIHNVDPDETSLPTPVRCTHEKITEDGAYILENGVHLFIWLGQSLSSTFVQSVFGVQCTQQVNAERFAITADTPLARRITDIIDQIMEERTRYMRVTCVRQNDKLESVFRHFLIEDRGTDGSASYVDFLCHMHKEIKDLLS